MINKDIYSQQYRKYIRRWGVEFCSGSKIVWFALYHFFITFSLLLCHLILFNSSKLLIYACKVYYTPTTGAISPFCFAATLDMAAEMK